MPKRTSSPKKHRHYGLVAEEQKGLITPQMISLKELITKKASSLKRLHHQKRTHHQIVINANEAIIAIAKDILGII